MATVLFIGGVSPEVTQNDLIQAFSKHTSLLASSIVRNLTDGRCVGQAYVTVLNEDVPKAIMLTEVGGNNVAVFPVEVEAWVAAPTAAAAGPDAAAAAAGLAAPPTSLPAAAAAAAAAGGGAALAGGLATPAYGWAADTTLGGGVAGGAVGGGPVPATWPAPAAAADQPGSSPLDNVHLSAVLAQIKSHLAGNSRLTYNGKTYFALLLEACQKRQMAPQAAEGHDGATFVCTITVLGPGGVTVCAGRATGPSKKDAKHNAASVCLERLLAAGQVTHTELVAAMTCAATSTGVGAAGGVGGLDSLGGVGIGGVGGGGGGGGSPATNPAAASAQAQTQAIMRLGLYPRCEEVMRQVHSTDQGRTKTVLMVLNEYAVKAKLTVHHDEVSVPSGATASPAAGPFKFRTRLTDGAGQLVALADGPELRSKQEARQAAAAALLDFLLAHNIATPETLAPRGK